MKFLTWEKVESNLIKSLTWGMEVTRQMSHNFCYNKIYLYLLFNSRTLRQNWVKLSKTHFSTKILPNFNCNFFNCTLLLSFLTVIPELNYIWRFKYKSQIKFYKQILYALKKNHIILKRLRWVKQNLTKGVTWV